MTSFTLTDCLKKNPLVPVVTLEFLEHAVPLAKTLLDAGIPCIEVTLRTPVAWSALALIKKTFPEMSVGAGTVIDTHQIKQAKQQGVDFLVSPGCLPSILEAAETHDMPLLPGVTNPSDVMRAWSYGYKLLKLFPAEIVGGVPLLKQFSHIFPSVQFCPTGGISLANASHYLALNNVLAVGGSWLTPRQLLHDKDWTGLQQLITQSRLHLQLTGV